MLEPITTPAGLALDVTEARQHVKQDVDFDDVLLFGMIASATEAAESETERTLLARRWRLRLDAFPGPALLGVPYGKPYTLPPHAIVLPRYPVQAVESIQYLAMSGELVTLDPAWYVVDYSAPCCRITPVFGRVWPVPLPQIGAVRVNFTAGHLTPVEVDGDVLTPECWQPLAVGDEVRFSVSGGAGASLPAPLKPGKTYLVQALATGGGIRVSDPASPSSALELTTQGVGTIYLGALPAAVKSWMLLRIDSLYAHRGEVATVSIAPMPYADRLLDPWRVGQF